MVQFNNDQIFNLASPFNNQLPYQEVWRIIRMNKKGCKKKSAKNYELFFGTATGSF